MSTDLGYVRFRDSRNGSLARARLRRDGTWWAPDPELTDDLNRFHTLADYSPADGFPGGKVLEEVATLLPEGRAVFTLPASHLGPDDGY